MPEAQGSLLPLAAWDVETLRVTAFPTPAAPAKDLTWWNDLIGEPPETTSSRPRESAKTEEGPFAGARLLNQVQPVRIDWALLPSQETVMTTDRFPSLGRLTDVLEPFVQLMTRWLALPSCPPLARLAFAATLLCPVDSKSAGYQQIAAYLHDVKLDPQNSFDFLYQINRPRASLSGIPDLIINRLSTWSVSAYRQFGIGITFPPSQQTHAVLGNEAFSCRIQLEVNTDQQRTHPLPSSSLSDLLEELVRLAEEIVVEGDIP